MVSTQIGVLALFLKPKNQTLVLHNNKHQLFHLHPASCNPTARLLGPTSHLSPTKQHPHSVQDWPTVTAGSALMDQTQTSPKPPSSLALSPISAVYLPSHHLLPSCWCLNPFPALQSFKTLLMGGGVYLYHVLIKLLCNTGPVLHSLYFSCTQGSEMIVWNSLISTSLIAEEGISYELLPSGHKTQQI